MTRPEPTLDVVKPADELVIDNLETLKVIADPLRKRILELFDKPTTVKTVAKQLDTTPSKLYYHVNMLEEHGLLIVTDTRIVSGIIEKHYQIAARMFKVKAGLLSPSPEAGDDALNTMLTNILDYTKEEIRTSALAGTLSLDGDSPTYRSLFLSLMSLRLKPDEATALRDRLEALLNELNQENEDEDDDSDPEFILQIAMFPIAPGTSLTDQDLGGEA